MSTLDPSVITDPRSITENVETIGYHKLLPPGIIDPKPYEVSFNGPGDPLHPFNWPLRKKFLIGLTVAFDPSCVAFGSSAFSPAITVISEDYNVGRVVATLGVSLFVLGFAVGPVFWAPLSEMYGRRPVLIFTTFVFTCFQFGAAAADDIQTILLCRAFGGLIGAASVVVAPATFSDMFDNDQRGIAINAFSMTIFMLPIIAPIAGQFIVDSYLGWRWTEYVTGIMGAGSFVFTTLFLEETYHPVVLVQKARELKKRTGIWVIHAPHDQIELSLSDILQTNIARPLKMLLLEPILLLVSIYNAFIYAILYLLLSAFPIVFREGYGITGGVSQLPYIGVALGMIIGAAWNLSYEKSTIEATKNNGNVPVPESRLRPCFVASFLFPVGLILFTWSGYYHEKVHWIVPCIGGVPIGFGLFTIYTATLNYVIDSYLPYSASAIAANTFLRSSLACAFPLFSVQMFHNMGVNWAGLLLALIAIILIPVPFLFYKYGKAIRGRSDFALK